MPLQTTARVSTGTSFTRVMLPASLASQSAAAAVAQKIAGGGK